MKLPFAKEKVVKDTKKGINHHFIFIEAPLELVAPEIVLWGEAGWWPKACKMKFIRKDTGEIKAGTHYEQRVAAFPGVGWFVEVTKLDKNREIERTFLNGMFKGYESVKLESYSNGTRIDYVMHYKICGILNKILWPLIFRKLHDKNIQMILHALKDHVIERQWQEQERKFEGHK